MNYIEGGTGSKLYCLHLRKGEDLLLELIKFLKEKNIINGVVVSGIGTFDRCSWHGVVNTEFPTKNEYYTVEDKPMELAALTGIIADGEPHLHMCLQIYDNERKVIVGHIEPGCRVLCLAEIAIMETNSVEMIRRPDEDGINQLQKL